MKTAQHLAGRLPHQLVLEVTERVLVKDLRVFLDCAGEIVHPFNEGIPPAN